MKSKEGWLCLTAFLLTIVIIIAFLAFPTKVTYEGLAEKALASTDPTTPASSTVTAKATNRTSNLPQVLLDISWCESRGDQSRIGYNYRYRTVTLADGSTTSEKYLWSRDIGRFQINEYYHAEEARRLGMDIYTGEGNAQYALVLYNSRGTRDWNASKPCWSNIEAYRAREQSFY